MDPSAQDDMGNIFLIVAVILSSLIFTSFLWKLITSYYPTIPSPYNIPIFGTALHLEKDQVKFGKQLMQFAEDFNHVFVLWLINQPLIFASNVEFTKTMLCCQSNLKKSYLYDFSKDWLGTGLLISYDTKWKTRRRILTPSFHFSILKEFSIILDKHAMNIVDRTEKCISATQKTIDIQPLVGLTTLEAIAETAMNITLNKEQNCKRYIESLRFVNEQVITRGFNPFIWSNVIYRNTSNGKAFYECIDYLHDFTVSMINRRIATRNKEGFGEHLSNDNEIAKSIKNNCLIDILLDSYERKEIDIDGIREEVDTFVFEGHDTTASAISFCLYCLGKNKKYQKLLQDEIDTTEGKSTWEKITKMMLLDYCLKESMRLYSPVPLIGRRLEQDMTVNGMKIFKDTDMILNIFMLHRNKEYWDDPLTFNPYRFKEENIKNRDPFSYIPFSAGPRNCIGQKLALMEAKLCIYYILKNFNLKSVQNEEELALNIDVVTKCQNGILIEFENRLK